MRARTLWPVAALGGALLLHRIARRHGLLRALWDAQWPWESRSQHISRLASPVLRKARWSVSEETATEHDLNGLTWEQMAALGNLFHREPEFRRQRPANQRPLPSGPLMGKRKDAA